MAAVTLPSLQLSVRSNAQNAREEHSHFPHQQEDDPVEQPGEGDPGGKQTHVHVQEESKKAGDELKAQTDILVSTQVRVVHISYKPMGTYVFGQAIDQCSKTYYIQIWAQSNPQRG